MVTMKLQEKTTKMSLPHAFHTSAENERKVQTENKIQVAQESTLHYPLRSQQIWNITQR